MVDEECLVKLVCGAAKEVWAMLEQSLNVRLAHCRVIERALHDPKRLRLRYGAMVVPVAVFVHEESVEIIGRIIFDPDQTDVVICNEHGDDLLSVALGTYKSAVSPGALVSTSVTVALPGVSSPVR